MVDISSLNSFKFEVFAESYLELDSYDKLHSIPVLSSNYLILGQGTNIAFIENFDGMIIHQTKKALSVVETESAYRVNVSAGYDWHSLVLDLNSKNIFGLENLALIPGTVGAAPVQNIGAYGAEFQQFCESVEAFDLRNKDFQTIQSEQCEFAYRDSLFKRPTNRHLLITEVNLKLPKRWQPNLSYKGLDDLSQNCSASEVLNRVIEVRSSKLPDPKKVGNAGSFFKNPIVSKDLAYSLKASYENMPHYKVDDSQIKIPAAFLIEKAGFKGVTKNGIGSYHKQPLVLVNNGNGSGKALLEFAREIKQKVLEDFGVLLENEVRLIGRNGDISL